MPRTYKHALEHYASLRRRAYDQVEEEAASVFTDLSIHLTDIDSRALEDWQAGWQGTHPSGAGGWDWERISRPFRKRPSAFHVAIWNGERLCGLAVGRASKKRRPIGVRHTVSVHYLEAAPGPDNPLAGRVAVLAIAAAERYGEGLGASRVRLMDPLPALQGYYRGLGFTIAWLSGNRVYCERRITR